MNTNRRIDSNARAHKRVLWPCCFYKDHWDAQLNDRASLTHDSAELVLNAPQVRTRMSADSHNCNSSKCLVSSRSCVAVPTPSGAWCPCGLKAWGCSKLAIKGTLSEAFMQLHADKGSTLFRKTHNIDSSCDFHARLRSRGLQHSRVPLWNTGRASVS